MQKKKEGREEKSDWEQKLNVARTNGDQNPGGITWMK